MAKPEFHGPDHRPGGPDPIPGMGGGGIDFNKTNSTDADGADADNLYIETNGTGSDDGISIINSADTGGVGILVENNNDDPLKIKQTGNGGVEIENDGTGPLSIKSLGGSGGDTTLETTHGTMEIGTAGSSKDLTFYVKDGNIYWLQGGDAGSPIMSLVWNGVSAYELHLPAGTTVHFDL